MARIKKVVELIKSNIDTHVHNDHNLRMCGYPSGISLNDAVLQILEHLGLEVDRYKMKLIDKSSIDCTTDEYKGKPVATVDYEGTVHTASKDADSKLVTIRPADEVTCLQCRKKLETQGFLIPVQDRK